MVVHSTREEKPFGIHQKFLEIRRFPISLIAFKDILDNMADRQVPTAVLIPCDVPPKFCSLTQMVSIRFFPKGQFLPPGHIEAHYLNVSELVNKCFHDVKIRDIHELFIYL